MNILRSIRLPTAPLLLVSVGLLLPPSSTAFEPQLYRVTRACTVEFRPDGATEIEGPFRLRGTFVMTQRISPLDWEFFQIEDLRLDLLSAEPQPPVWRGEGSFSRSGRFDRMRLELDVRFGEAAVHLDSGELPATAWGPDLDIVLEGGGSGPAKPGTYIVRFAAVPELSRWRYRLIEGSTLTDDCGPCARPTVSYPLRGGFDLVLVGESPLFSRYHLFDLRFEAGTDHVLEGEGEYQVGGEVALRQECRLDLDTTGAFVGPRTARLEATPGSPTRAWPMWATDAFETDAAPLSKLTLVLRAAPFRELWFSTAHGMTPAYQPDLEPRVSGGDVLTDLGRRVSTNADLIAALGWTSLKEPLLIDALTVAPGGELWFSFSESQDSPALGPIGHGDLVSSHGRIVQRNHELFDAFGLMPPVPDLGLDGVQCLDDGEVLFSITEPAFSERLGVTETGFESKTLGWLMGGAILSDQGYVVGRNLDLVGAFQPLEDLADFGLDGLFVITDIPPMAPPGRLSLRVDPLEAGVVRLSWQAQARVFQVEKTLSLDDPFAPLSPIIPVSTWSDSLSPAPPARGFYRVRQW